MNRKFRSISWSLILKPKMTVFLDQCSVIRIVDCDYLRFLNVRYLNVYFEVTVDCAEGS